jgi:hypothetical protein
LAAILIAHDVVAWLRWDWQQSEIKSFLGPITAGADLLDVSGDRSKGAEY